MNEWKETRLPESITGLINSEKETGLKKFQTSGFGEKIVKRIMEQKKNRRISLKWILVPASLVFLFISIFLLFQGEEEKFSGKNNFQLVLEAIIEENGHPGNGMAGSVKEREKFEILQKKILSSVVKNETICL